MDNFGVSVDMTEGGHIVVVGTNGGEYTKVLEFMNEYWITRQTLSPKSTSRFGYSISISSDTSRLIIGAPYANSNGSLSGSVHIYQLSPAFLIYTSLQTISGSMNDEVGNRVAISSDGTFLQWAHLAIVSKYLRSILQMINLCK